MEILNNEIDNNIINISYTVNDYNCFTSLNDNITKKTPIEIYNLMEEIECQGNELMFYDLGFIAGLKHAKRLLS